MSRHQQNPRPKPRTDSRGLLPHQERSQTGAVLNHPIGTCYSDRPEDWARNTYHALEEYMEQGGPHSDTDKMYLAGVQHGIGMGIAAHKHHLMGEYVTTGKMWAVRVAFDRPGTRQEHFDYINRTDALELHAAMQAANSFIRLQAQIRELEPTAAPDDDLEDDIIYMDGTMSDPNRCLDADGNAIPDARGGMIAGQIPGSVTYTPYSTGYDDIPPPEKGITNGGGTTQYGQNWYSPIFELEPEPEQQTGQRNAQGAQLNTQQAQQINQRTQQHILNASQQALPQARQSPALAQQLGRQQTQQQRAQQQAQRIYQPAQQSPQQLPYRKPQFIPQNLHQGFQGVQQNLQQGVQQSRQNFQQPRAASQQQSSVQLTPRVQQNVVQQQQQRIPPQSAVQPQVQPPQQQQRAHHTPLQFAAASAESDDDDEDYVPGPSRKRSRAHSQQQGRNPHSPEKKQRK
ncbi:hypothetical protein G7054_g14353 [Neopestalotiopsis clavispora]|nr:hypothetical protein G7054_g14353 [Neopestalotiopsis clavispora]